MYRFLYDWWRKCMRYGLLNYDFFLQLTHWLMIHVISNTKHNSLVHLCYTERSNTTGKCINCLTTVFYIHNGNPILIRQRLYIETGPNTLLGVVTWTSADSTSIYISRNYHSFPLSIYHVSNMYPRQIFLITNITHDMIHNNIMELWHKKVFQSSMVLLTKLVRSCCFFFFFCVCVFSIVLPKSLLKKKIELPVIWEAMSLMWHHCNVCTSEFVHSTFM